MTDPEDPDTPWFIYPSTNPELIEDESGVSHIIATYKARDEAHKVTVYEKTCQTPVENVFDEVSSYTQADEVGEIDITADLTVDLPKILSSDSIYTDYNDGTGVAEFCVEAALHNGNDKVVSHKTVYTADVSVVEGFFTLSNVVLQGNDPDYVNDLDIGYGSNATVYQCYPDSMIEIEDPPPLYPGEELVVCVKTNDETVGVSSIYKMALKQIRDGVTYNFDAIVEGFEYSPNEDLVEYWCDQGICVVSMVLIQQFFEDGTNTSLNVFGQALLGGGNSEKDGEEGENNNSDFSYEVNNLRSCSDKGGLMGVLSTVFLS